MFHTQSYEILRSFFHNKNTHSTSTATQATRHVKLSFRFAMLLVNKKAELSQRWPRDASALKTVFGIPDYAHDYFSRNFKGFSSDWCKLQNF